MEGFQKEKKSIWLYTIIWYQKFYNGMYIWTKKNFEKKIEKHWKKCFDIYLPIMRDTSPTIRDFDNKVHIVIGKRNIDRGQCFAFWAGMCLNCGSDSVFQQFWHYIIQRHFNVGKFGIYMTRNADFRAMTIFVFGNLLVKVRKFQKDIVGCSILPKKKFELVEVSFFLSIFPCSNWLLLAMNQKEIELENYLAKTKKRTSIGSNIHNFLWKSYTEMHFNHFPSL